MLMHEFVNNRAMFCRFLEFRACMCYTILKCSAFTAKRMLLRKDGEGRLRWQRANVAH